MADLSTKTSRKSLRRRREPHWQRLAKGRFLGFRRGPDSWIARFTDKSYKQHYKALCVCPERGRSEYDMARELAEEFFRDLGSGAVRSLNRGTVKDALETYLKHLRRQDRPDTARTSQERFELIVWSDPIADILLEDLTLDDMESWRDRLRAGRQNRTVNRHVSSVKAGLNVAVKKGHAGRQEAWALTPLQDCVEQTAETTIFLSPEQRERLYKAACPPCADFMRAISLTGGRPGELAAAIRQDLDASAGTLVLKHRKGRPPIVRSRAVELSPKAIAFFKGIARGKLPAAPLLIDPNGNQWNRHKWADEIQAAIANQNRTGDPGCKLPKGISAYSFRHARISELLQVAGVNPITVGQQTGTSVAMIEKYYYRFIGTALQDKLALLDSVI